MIPFVETPAYKRLQDEFRHELNQPQYLQSWALKSMLQQQQTHRLEAARLQYRMANDYVVDWSIITEGCQVLIYVDRLEVPKYDPVYEISETEVWSYLQPIDRQDPQYAHWVTVWHVCPTHLMASYSDGEEVDEKILAHHIFGFKFPSNA